MLVHRIAASLLVLAAAAGRAAGGDAPGDASIEAARQRLLEVVAAEERTAERTKAVADVAAIGSPSAAKVLAEALDKLAARTADSEVRAAKTREDYAPYQGASQRDPKAWALKERLLRTVEHDDSVLRADLAVEEAFAEAVAGLKDKQAVEILDRALAKAALVHARRALYPGLLRNPASNAADLAKRAMADSDPGVRLLALAAFAERRSPAFVEHAVKALSDPMMPIREAAAKALGASGETKAVGPLVTAIVSAEGRLIEDYAQALAALTGVSLGPNPDAWKRWYEDHKDELAAKGAKATLPKGAMPQLAPPVDYYGIETRSLRLLFLIDCSGSMNELIGEKGVTTGTQFQGPKIEIAKRMLKAAVSKLAPSTWFDVIVFSGDARAMNGKMVQATPEVKYATYESVDALQARGGTYTYGALKLAFGIVDVGVTPSDPKLDTIFLLSDGAPTEAQLEEGAEAKPMEPAKILDSVHQWNRYAHVKIHTIAIDPRIEKGGQNFVRFMKDLAAQNWGTYTAIGSE